MQSFKKHLAEKLKASDDMGDWVKDFQDSDAPQFKGKSQKKRQQMAVAAKLGAERDAGMREEVEQLDELSPNTLHSYIKKASGNLAGNSAANAAVAAVQVDKPKSQKANRKDLVRNIRNRMKGITSASGRLADKANQNESVELDEQTQYDLVEAYLLENNIDVDSLSVEQLNEIIGKVLGTAFKVGARTAVGAAKLAKKAVVNKQGNIRGTRAARDDAAGDRAEKEARKKEAEFKRKKRIQDMKKRASDLDQKISDLSNNK